MSCRILLNPLSVRDVEYTPHENTGKRNHKWVKLKSNKGRRSGEAGRRDARSPIWTISWHLKV